MAGDWVEVGQVVKLQIQRRPLRDGEDYRLDPLAEVSTLRLTPDGPIGFDGVSWIVDCHHRHHPQATNYRPGRALSIGFTSHYENIWKRFTPIPLGAGGENLIVSSDQVISEAELDGGIRIGTSQASILLSDAKAAEPCVAFTRLVTGRPEAKARELAEDRERLRHGVRGFVMPVDGIDLVDVTPGTPVAIRAT
ncbi:MAG: hypothetical protein F4Y40_05065 [Acidimicrobiia bacterium]|nr:hypothetical protein [Acidimicrobiia bacterium]MYF82685.1 hypothetical protein [Acidimicrobiia bacterium]